MFPRVTIPRIALGKAGAGSGAGRRRGTPPAARPRRQRGLWPKVEFPLDFNTGLLRAHTGQEDSGDQMPCPSDAGTQYTSESFGYFHLTRVSILRQGTFSARTGTAPGEPGQLVTGACLPAPPPRPLLRARPGTARCLLCSHCVQCGGTWGSTASPPPWPVLRDTKSRGHGPMLRTFPCTVTKVSRPAPSASVAGTDPDSSTTGAWSKPFSRRISMVCSQVTVGSTVSGADRLSS